MYYLGFDVGTSALKTTLMDESKQIVYESTSGYHYEEPLEGYKEIDPKVWEDAILEELQRLGTKFDADEIAAAGVTGQMHTTVFLDAEGKSIRPAIMWNDLRTKKLVEPVKKQLEDQCGVKEIVKILSTGSPVLNTLWVKKYEPDHFQKIHRILTVYDYIAYYLTGVYCCDYCGASTSSFYDIQGKKWSQAMMDLVGVNESFFGEIYGSCDIIGTFSDKICKKIGIKKAIPVIAGTGDNPATAVAMGILEQKKTVISLGTSGVIISPRDQNDFSGKGKNVLFQTKKDHMVNVRQGVVQEAGGAHRWWVENIVQSNQMDIDQKEMCIEDLGNNKIIFYPHIAGDKTLYSDANLRGMFIGLSTYTKRKHMTQAVFEGVAYAFKELLEAMQLEQWPEQIQINGGGTKSQIWMQIMANVLNMTVEAVNTNATPGYGICLLALEAVRKCETTKSDKTHGIIYRPNSEIVEKYQQAYQKYQKVHDAIQIII